METCTSSCGIFTSIAVTYLIINKLLFFYIEANNNSEIFVDIFQVFFKPSKLKFLFVKLCIEIFIKSSIRNNIELLEVKIKIKMLRMF